MPWAAVGAVAASAIGGVIQSGSASDAANAQTQAAGSAAQAQVQAAQIASNTELGMFNQETANMSPYLGAGTLALGDLMALTGMTGAPPGGTWPTAGAGAAGAAAGAPTIPQMGGPGGVMQPAAGGASAAGPAPSNQYYVNPSMGGAGLTNNQIAYSAANPGQYIPPAATPAAAPAATAPAAGGAGFTGQGFGTPTSNLGSIMNSPLLSSPTGLLTAAPTSLLSAAPTSLLDAPTAANFRNSPGYGFTLQQGEQAIQDSASAAGGIGGNQLKALMGYGSGLASQDWWNYYQNTSTTNANKYNAMNSQNVNTYNAMNSQDVGLYNATTANQNRTLQTLAGMANSGQNAAGNLGAAGTATAASIGANTIGAGNAAAQGFIGAGNATAANSIAQGNIASGAIQSAFNNTGVQNMLSNLFTNSGQGTGYGAQYNDLNS